MGAEATLALMEATPESVPVVISLDGNQTVRVPLMECVERTQAVAKAMKEKRWADAVKLRGRSFERNLETYKMLTRLKPPKECFDAQGKGIEGYRLAVMHIGAPACGMNAAVRSFVRNAIYRGDVVFGINDGVEGLIAGNVRELGWCVYRLLRCTPMLTGFLLLKVGCVWLGWSGRCLSGYQAHPSRG